MEVPEVMIRKPLVVYHGDLVVTRASIHSVLMKFTRTQSNWQELTEMQNSIFHIALGECDVRYLLLLLDIVEHEVVSSQAMCCNWNTVDGHHLNRSGSNHFTKPVAVKQKCKCRC